MIGVSDAVSSAALPLGNTSPVWRWAWHPVAPAAEVTGAAPAQVLVAGEAWVLARLDGRVVAFEDQCPHRQSPLSAGDITRAADGTARLTCAYHGWRFDAAGGCDLMPALGLRDRRRLQKAGRPVALRAAYGVTEAYGLIWLAPREPFAPLPAFPEWNAPGMTRTSATTVRTSVSPGQLIGNFLATGLLGTVRFPGVPAVGAVSPAVADVTVCLQTWQVTGVFNGPGGTAPGLTGTAAPRLRKTAGVSGSAHARLELGHATIGMLVACQPEDWMTTRVFTLMAFGGIGGEDLAVEGSLDTLSTGTLSTDALSTDPLSTDPLSSDLLSSDPLSTAWRHLMARASATVRTR